MKTKIIMMTALLALLATGCGKDKIATRVSLFTGNMTTVGNGAKIYMDPNGSGDYNAKWVENEPISIKGNGNAQSYPIMKNGSAYRLENVEAEGTRYAIYPGPVNANGNNVAVANNGSAGSTITLNELAVKLLADGGSEVIFPMAAKSSDTDNELHFSHLTAGIILSLKANNDINEVSKVDVIVYRKSASDEDPVEVSGVGSYTVKWAQQGSLPLPWGGIGTGEDQDMKYASVMTLNMKDSEHSTNYVNITSEPISFCVPVTISSMNRITIVGYDNSGNPLFSKTAAMQNDATLELELNKMYRFPVLTVDAK